MPHGVLINGKGPYRYNDTLVPDGIEHESIEVHPGNTTLLLPQQEVKRKRSLLTLYLFYFVPSLHSINMF